MSDRFYDNKGIEHIGVFAKQNAEDANRRYLREEEKAREQGLELQRQQVEATERAARDTEQHRQEQAEAERKRLSELHRQGAAAQRDRDYQNTLLFLKESDEATRLDTFVEILVKSLDWKCCPGYEKGDYDDAWCAEQKKILSRFYQLPAVPQECRENGTLTRNIKTLVNSGPDSPSVQLPPKAIMLKEEIERIEIEIKGIPKTDFYITLLLCFLVFGGPRFYHRRFISGALQLLTFGGFLCWWLVDLVMILSGKFKDKNGVPIGGIHAQQVRAERKKTLVQKRDSLKNDLQPYLIEAQSQARQARNDAVENSVEQWFSTYRNSLLRSFFDQELWIYGGFQTRLKEVLTEIQKPFPTSCRADVNKLNKSQIESAYKALVSVVVDLFSFKLSRWPMPPGHNMNLIFSYALFPDKNLDYDEYTKQEAVFLEKGVFLKGDKEKEHLDRQKRIVTEILMTGPSSPSTLTSNESEHKDDAVGKVHPIVADKSGQKTGASGMTYIKLPDHPSDNVSS